MDIHILDFTSSLNFIPNKPTYALRIFNVTGPQDFVHELLYSENWIRIVNCYFHDTNPEEAKRLCFSHFLEIDYARKMVRDFARYKDRCEAVMIHCMAGMNRSPAVAVAFNDIFGLGNDSQTLRNQYTDLNEYAYETIIKAGKLEGII